MKVWTLQYRREEADAEDFNIISLHETRESAKAEAESDSDSEEGFTWSVVPGSGGNQELFSRADDDESACYLVEEWPVRP